MLLPVVGVVVEAGIGGDAHAGRQLVQGAHIDAGNLDDEVGVVVVGLRPIGHILEGAVLQLGAIQLTDDGAQVQAGDLDHSFLTLADGAQLLGDLEGDLIPVQVAAVGLDQELLQGLLGLSRQLIHPAGGGAQGTVIPLGHGGTGRLRIAGQGDQILDLVALIVAAVGEVQIHIQAALGNGLAHVAEALAGVDVDLDAHQIGEDGAEQIGDPVAQALAAREEGLGVGRKVGVLLHLDAEGLAVVSLGLGIRVLVVTHCLYLLEDYMNCCWIDQISLSASML